VKSAPRSLLRIREGGPREAAFVSALHLRSDELGCSGGPLLFCYREERHLDEKQIRTSSQEIDSARIQIEIINGLDRFASIAGDWDRLVQRADVDRVFCSHTWFRTWWESFGADRQLHVLTAWMGGELVAAVPLMRTVASLYGFRLKTLESIYNPHTARYDVIVANKSASDLYPRIWNHLSRTEECDAIVLKQIPEGSQTVAAIERLAREDGWLSGQWSGRPSPYIPLACDYENFIARLKGNYRYNLRKRYERLGKLGPIDVEVVSERGSVRDAMRDGMKIEAAAWKGDQGTAINSDTAVAEFYTQLAERESESGRLRLSFLRVGGRRIAFNYLLRGGDKIYGVKIGYDPEYHTYSPGNTLLNLILKEACAEGLVEYDFLGTDDKWKLDWTKETRRHSWLFLFKDHLRSRALHYLKFSVVPKIRRVRVRQGCTYPSGQA
jgi:CelD/BcsL family acetyltransferase involved in cellulose biosynthesis